MTANPAPDAPGHRGVRDSRLWVWGIAGVALAVRLLWVLAVQPEPTHDCKWYLGRANVFAERHELVVGGRPTAYRPPLYPVVLGSVFTLSEPSPHVMRGFNVVCSTLSVILLYVVTLRLGRSQLAAASAALLFALYPTDIAYTSLAVSESCFNMLILGAIAAAPRGKRWRLLVAAAGCCAAMLTRAQGALLVPIVGAWLLVHTAAGRRVRAGLVFCAIILALVSPYWLRNARAFGAFVPIANNGGVNLYIGNNPVATGGYRFDRKVELTLPRPFDMKRLGNGGPDESQIDRELNRLARKYIEAHPAETLAKWPAKLSLLYRTDPTAFDWNNDHKTRHGWFYAAAASCNGVYYAGLWLLALGAVLTQWRRNPRVLLALVLVTLLTASHLVYFGDPRFHHPMMPWVSLLAGVWVASAWHAVRAGVRASV
ncbi:MAG: glycosyltransferase family 39 protein [Polyangiales bacterium]